MLLHQRLGHIGKDRLERLLKENLADGIIIDPKSELKDICEHCIAGKQHREPFPHASDNQSPVLLGRVHSDLHGPLPKTPHGYRYWLTLVDDMSRYKRVYLLKKKSEAFSQFKEYVAEAERELGAQVKQLRDDKGGEYMSGDFIRYCRDKGISRQHTVKATPQQNPVAERLNRTLAEGTVAMLNQANLPVAFWGQAVLYLTHILNATPSSSLSETTSYEIWKKRKPNLTMYCVFGCRAFVNVQKKDRSPLHPHTARCIFIGFNEGYKGWKLYNPITHKVLTSRDVIFDEMSFPGTKGQLPDEPVPKVLPRDLWQYEGSQDVELLPRDDETLPGFTSDQRQSSTQNSLQVPPDPTALQLLSKRSEGHVEELLLERVPITPQNSNEIMSHQTPSTSSTLPDRPAPIPHRSAPLIAQGTRPIRKKRILDYSELEGRTRRTTQPVARR